MKCKKNVLTLQQQKKLTQIRTWQVILRNTFSKQNYWYYALAVRLTQLTSENHI